MIKIDKVTINDVAKLANVSAMTVSRVIRSSHEETSVSKETHKRVTDAIRRLNYRPHSGASSIRSKLFNRIGMILSEERISWDAELLEGVNSALLDKNIGLMLVRITPDRESLPFLVEQYQIDGLIADHSVSFKLKSTIEQNNISVIWVNNNNHSSHNCIWPDDINGAYIATQHLIKLGHRDIAFLRDPRSTHSSLAMRLEGYRKCLFENDFSERVIDIYLSDPDIHPCIKLEEINYRYAHKEVWSAFKLGSIPTAFVCYNTNTAIEFYSMCNRNNMNINKDFSIVSCDNSYIGEKLFPSLTSVVIDFVGMGTEAVDMLLEYIKTSRPIPSKLFETKLLIRESSHLVSKELPPKIDSSEY